MRARGSATANSLGAPSSLPGSCRDILISDDVDGTVSVGSCKEPGQDTTTPVPDGTTRQKRPRGGCEDDFGLPPNGSVTPTRRFLPPSPAAPSIVSPSRQAPIRRGTCSLVPSCLVWMRRWAAWLRRMQHPFGDFLPPSPATFQHSLANWPVCETHSRRKVNVGACAQAICLSRWCQQRPSLRSQEGICAGSFPAQPNTCIRVSPFMEGLSTLVLHAPP